MTPKFWYRDEPAPLILQPLAQLYHLARRIHVALTIPSVSPLPTICVGNATAGGSGKTPVVQAVRAIMDHFNPVVLTRGYGGSLTGPVQVHDDHNAMQVGDEALLHAQHGPVVVSKNRLLGAHFIAEHGGVLAIMDDGLQNRTLTASCNILVVDGATGFGNGAMIPAGPLREPVADVAARAHMAVIIGDDLMGAVRQLPPDLPIFTATMQADMRAIDRTRRYMAFCGIGRPDKFFATLEANDISVMARRVFADHHAYTKQDIAALIDDAARMGVGLICTSKDIVKIRALTHAHIDILPVVCVIDNPQQLQTLILEKTGLS